MNKNDFIEKKEYILNFVKELCSLFIITPSEISTHSFAKKYFSDRKVSDAEELYSDWKYIGNDMRYVINIYEPVFQNEIKKITYNKKDPEAVAHK